MLIERSFRIGIKSHFQMVFLNSGSSIVPLTKTFFSAIYPLCPTVKPIEAAETSAEDISNITNKGREFLCNYQSMKLTKPR